MVEMGSFDSIKPFLQKFRKIKWTGIAFTKENNVDSTMQIGNRSVPHINESANHESAEIFTMLADVHIPLCVVTPNTSGG